MPILRWALKLLNRATHVVLFIAGFLGRGFNSRRLHHDMFNNLQVSVSKNVSTSKYLPPDKARDLEEARNLALLCTQ